MATRSPGTLMVPGFSPKLLPRLSPPLTGAGVFRTGEEREPLLTATRRPAAETAAAGRIALNARSAKGGDA